MKSGCCWLLLLGNQHLLECDEAWRQLIADYKRRKAVVRVDRFLDGIIKSAS